MKVTLDRTNFVQELQIVQRATSSKTAIPILTDVKITLTQEGLTLTGSNADIPIGTSLSVKNGKTNMQVEPTRPIVLQARFFSGIIRRLPEGTFTLEVLENKRVTIASGKANFIVNGLDADDYPHLPVVESRDQMESPVHVLAKLITEIVFAVSQHESRLILTGVHFVLSNHFSLTVATDSHRLNQRVIPVKQMADHLDIAIPGKSLVGLSRSSTNEEETAEISIVENQVLFKTKTVYFYSRLLGGNCPDTNRSIPSSFNTEVEFSALSFLAAIGLASLLSHEGRNNIVRLSTRPDAIVLCGNSPEIGRVEENLSYTASNGDPLEISFSPDYMKAALHAFGDMSIRIRLIPAIRSSTLESMKDDVQFT